MKAENQARFYTNKAGIKALPERMIRQCTQKILTWNKKDYEDGIFDNLMILPAPAQFIYAVAFQAKLQEMYAEIGGQPTEVGFSGSILNTQAERIARFKEKSYSMSERQVRELAKIYAKLSKVLQ